ncbi:MAG TPA: serine hydrolase domain-containing protein [Pseudomonadales bacterium]
MTAGRRRAVPALGLLLLTAAAAPCAKPQTAADSARWQSLAAELEAIQRENRVPVLILAILDEGRPALLHTSTYGSGTGFRPSSPFRWGSISKTVTALALMEAARRHGIALSTPVPELLDPLPYRNPWGPTQPVRLAHLLELTAGFADLSADELNDNRPLPLARALSRGADRRVLLWPPGLQHSYSNVAPGISSAVVERLSGLPFEQAARRLVFEPLGMAPASFEPVAGLPGGFRANGRTPIPYWHMTFPAFGALNASPEAMTRLLEALLNRGRLDGRAALAPTVVERLFRMETSLAARHGLEVGYGAGVYGWLHGGHRFHGHGGDADGYRSRFGLLTGFGRGYLLGINVDHPSLLRRLQQRVEQALTEDLPDPELPPVARLPERQLARYAGRWYPSAARFGVGAWQQGHASRAEVRVRAGGLELRHRGRSTRLVPVDATRFRRPSDSAVTAVFAEHDGRLYLQGELGNFVRESGDEPVR